MANRIGTILLNGKERVAWSFKIILDGRIKQRTKYGNRILELEKV